MAATDLPAGSAKGSLTYDSATAELKFAAAFVDQKDERKPIVLVISDQKLQVEKWESEFDVMLAHSKWSGVVFFLNEDGKFFAPTCTSTAGNQASQESSSSRSIILRAKISPEPRRPGEKKTKLNAAFHVTLK